MLDVSGHWHLGMQCIPGTERAEATVIRQAASRRLTRRLIIVGDLPASPDEQAILQRRKACC